MSRPDGARASLVDGVAEGAALALMECVRTTQLVVGPGAGGAAREVHQRRRRVWRLWLDGEEQADVRLRDVLRAAIQV